MKSTIISLLVLFVLHSNHAQVSIAKKSTETIINATIWKPFKQSYEARDWEAFNALHSDHILRIHDGGIQQGMEYKNSIKKSYQKKDKRTITIDFAMERRMYTDNVGYEVGFYRVVYKQSDKKSRTSFGRFHVMLKKINGKWKIAQDWDTNSVGGKPVEEYDFNQGELLLLNE
ncbi:MAG: YybH family protein [Flavobacteriaceae bacterium]